MENQPAPPIGYTGSFPLSKALSVKMSTNPINTKLTREIKSRIFPILKEYGFGHFSGRKAWKHFDEKVYLFQITGVGSNFSNVTGFPAVSVTTSINIYYINFPGSNTCKKHSKSGLPLPSETECYFRFGLDKTDLQETYIKNITSPTEKKRRDVWWVSEDGENIDLVIDNITEVLKEHALKLVEKSCYQYNEQLRRINDR